ncbi:MAG: DMT family transporter [Pseudomonadota bacterium]
MLAIVGCILIATMGAMAKALGSTLPAVQIAFLRFLLAAPVVLLVAGRPALRLAATHHLGLHMLRAALAGLALVGAFYAYAKLPLAEAAALLFVEPLAIVVLAACWFGRPLTPRKLCATALGLIGVLVILQPGWGMFTTAGAVALAAATMAAGCALVIRAIVQREGDGPLLLLGTLLTAACLAIPAALSWVAPTPTQWLGLVGLAAIGSLAQLMIMRAYRLAPPELLAPFEYVQLPTAFLIGAVVFAEPLTGVVLLGTFCIVGASFLASWSRHRSIAPAMPALDRP